MKDKGQCMLFRFDGHGQIGPPSPTWNALSGPLRGSSESFSCSSHYVEMAESPRIALGFRNGLGEAYRGLKLGLVLWKKSHHAKKLHQEDNLGPNTPRRDGECSR
ncbi:unnamed protein product [Pleuronectes platessa]|uniref:Uncharacterized protein n=1 Tax=Pleuronectes platessa TaxID=8262 RepID=A0A9N7UEH7_PLEPL|nr:unnamed protein product [Pleuronectes platessa]